MKRIESILLCASAAPSLGAAAERSPADAGRQCPGDARA